jgi:hypothetical protein
MYLSRIPTGWLMWNGVIVILLLACLPQVSARSVITFHEMNACERVAALPECALVVKCYGRRLVVDDNSCSNRAWASTMEGIDTIESDYLVDASAESVESVQSSILSTESTPWLDRWWPLSGGTFGIGAEMMWHLTTGSTDTVIAVLDSGLPSLAHPLFAHVVAGYDFVSDSSLSQDGDGRDSNWEDPGCAGPYCIPLPVCLTVTNW